MDALCDFDRTTPQFSDEAPTTDYVLSCNATSTDELAEAVSEWRFEFLQLERGHFEGTVTCLRFDRVLVCCGSMNRSLLQRYTTPAHCITIARPGRTSSPMLHRGRAISAGECLVAGPSVSGEIVSRGAHAPLAVSVRMDAWDSGSPWLAPSALSSDGATLLAPGSTWVNILFQVDADMIRFALLVRHGLLGKCHRSPPWWLCVPSDSGVEQIVDASRRQSAPDMLGRCG